MSATILDDITETELRHHELASSAKKVADEIQNTIASKQEEKRSLLKQVGQKKRRLEDAQQEGLDATPLTKTIADLESKAAQLEAEVERLQREHDKSAKITAPNFEREKLLARLLVDVFGSKHAAPVGSLDSCWALLPVDVSKWDPAGRPLECSVRLGRNAEKTVALAGNERRFSKRFKPEALRWLPDAMTADDTEKQSGLAVQPDVLTFRQPNGRLILSNTKLSWREECAKAPQYYGGRETTEYRSKEDDFADVADSLGTRFDEIVEAAGGSLDLTRESGVALLDHLRAVVLSRTTAEPRFEPWTVELTSAEVFELIKAHWLAFVRAPWSRELRDKFALLKYSVENGERARFWTEDFKNHFGFRLRTRDHDWITGKIFITAACEKSTKPRITIHGHGNDHSGWTAEVAGMWIVVYGR